MPLSLSDNEMALVNALATPLDQRLRSDFLRAVAVELETQQSAGALGEGTIHRAAAAVQKQFFQPPQFGVGRR